MASKILLLKIPTHKKSMYSLVANVKSQKNHSSDVNNQNLEQLYMDKFMNVQIARIHKMIGLKNLQLLGKANTCERILLFVNLEYLLP